MTPLTIEAQQDILKQALPIMSDEALLEQYEYFIRQGMGETYWALAWIRREILSRMKGAL